MDHMIVFAEYSADTILPMLGLVGERGWVDTKSRRAFDINGKTFNVKTNSLRLQCFANNHTCVKCGLVGKLFRLEMHRSGLKSEDPSPHLNMYATKDDGTLILMTKDHIMPKSKGGKDHLKNFQTMCHACNEQKGSTVADQG